MYALAYFRASIRSIISAWKMTAEPAYPIGNRKYEYLVNISIAFGSYLMVL